MQKLRNSDELRCPDNCLGRGGLDFQSLSNRISSFKSAPIQSWEGLPLGAENASHNGLISYDSTYCKSILAFRLGPGNPFPKQLDRPPTNDRCSHCSSSWNTGNNDCLMWGGLQYEGGAVVSSL